MMGLLKKTGRYNGISFVLTTPYKLGAYGLIVLFLLSGCKKFLEPDLPINRYTSNFVFSNSSTAIQALTGIYTPFITDDNSLKWYSIFGGLLADEFTTNFVDDNVYRNEGPLGLFWNDLYSKVIFRCNSVIEGASVANSIPESTKTIIIGEAKFMRAFAYFQLVNLYGDVPLVTTTDWRKNGEASRTSTSNIYDQIIADLKEAEESLKDQYLGQDLLSSSADRVRPNRGAAIALLAKVYLFTKRWTEAETESTKLIANTSMYELTTLDKVFLRESKEAIWQLQPNPLNIEGTNTFDGRIFISGEFGGSIYRGLSDDLLSSFEINDKRKDQWTTNIDFNGTVVSVPFKYKKGNKTDSDPQDNTVEFLMVFRLGEIYLIRSEARAQQDNLVGSKEDLNKIRRRGGLPDIQIDTQSDLLDAIQHERRIELFSEWGNRWFDLKRTNKINEVMSKAAITKGGSWASYKALLGIPSSEFTNNHSLRGQQNPGYPELW